MSRFIVTVLLYGLLFLGCGAATLWLVSTSGAQGPKPAPAPVPAIIPTVLKEDKITTMTLTADAIKRLDLKTAVAVKKPMPRARTYGGEIVVPVGRTILVSAPLSGALKAPSTDSLQSGRTVKKGQTLFLLSPLLSPEGKATLGASKVDADGQVQDAEAKQEAARIVLDRARKLYQRDAGSRRAVEDAQAQSDIAKKAVEAAKAKRELLTKVVGDFDKGTITPMPIDSPQSGFLRLVTAQSGQTVPSGAPLFEVVNMDRAWVRVSVFVGELSEVDEASAAQITGLTARPGEKGVVGLPAIAPPSANPALGTVDFFYEIDNRTAVLRPGQRVGVSLRLKGESESLTLPWSAVVHDIFGGTWVYEETGVRQYTRRRVLVRHVAGDTAVLAAGPAPGARIVFAGAAELFGTETGFSK